MKQASWAFRNALVSPEAMADPVLKALWRPKTSAIGSPACRGSPAFAAAASSRLRSVSVRPMVARRARRVLAATRHLDGGYYETYSGGFRACTCRPGTIRITLTATSEFLGPEPSGEGTAAPDPRSLDPWRPQRFSVRRRVVWANGAAGSLGGRLARLPAAVLRHVIKGAALDEPNVRIFVMGGDRGAAPRMVNSTMAGAGLRRRTGRCRGSTIVKYYLHEDGSSNAPDPAPMPAAVVRF